MHTTHWRNLALGSSVLLALATSACGSDAGSSDGAGSRKLGFVSSASNEWGTCLVKGAKAAAAEKDIDLNVTYSDADPAKELANVEDLIAQQVDAIVLNTVNVDALSGAIQKAKAADIPLYLTAVVPESLDDVLGASVVDLPAAGGLAAEWVAKDAAGQDASVAVIAGAPGASSDYVVKGFKGALSDNVDVVAEQPGMFNRAKAQDVAENIVRANPDIDYAFVLNEDMAFGARAAFDDAGKTGVKIVSINGTDPGLAAVKDGQLSATVSDSASELGASSVKQALALLDDPAAEKVFQMTNVLITKDNLDDAIPFCG